jgi:hypothetical protein
MTNKFVVPSNFRYIRVPIQLSDNPASGDRVFGTFEEARAWVVDIAQKLIASNQSVIDTCYDEEDYDDAVKGRDRARRLLKTVQEMTPQKVETP